jgi:hypothetical protein
LRKGDPVFRAAWDDALQAALDELELELRRRAMQGVEQPVYYGGKECGRIRTYNDALGMFLLRSKRGLADDGTPAADGGDPAQAANQPSAREMVEDRLRRLARTGGGGDKEIGDKDGAEGKDGTAA